jgi:hypothetical protein
VILARQPPVGFLDFFRLSVSLNPEDFVEVFLGHLETVSKRRQVTNLKDDLSLHTALN